MREIGTVKFDSNQYTDANMLLNFDLIDPVKLNRNLTYLWGKDSDKYPLLTLTEGQGAVTTKVKLNGGDTQYTWEIAPRQRVTSRLKKLVSDKAAIQPYGTVEVEMEDNWFIYQHTAIAPSGMQWRQLAACHQERPGPRVRRVVLEPYPSSAADLRCRPQVRS